MRNNFLTLLTCLVVASSFTDMAAQGGCYDGSAYVNFKNVGATGGYTLQAGFQERASQTYRYVGTGSLSRIRVEGTYPGTLFWWSGIPMRVVVYSVDANGRPTSALRSQNFFWGAVDQSREYADVTFSSPVSISGNFAVAVELRDQADQFRVRYTGDGEGQNENLASLAGTSTGFNWVSAQANFNKDGDFYIIPYVTSNLVARFDASTQCAAVGQTVSFTNNSVVERGGMFNLISRTGYSGSNTNYTWNFGDGTATSSATNPTHTFSSPGRYFVTLTVKHQKWDNSVCTQTYRVPVSVGLALAASNPSNPTCYGLENGSITASRTGGAAPFTFSLDGGPYGTASTFNGLGAGAHTLYVRDSLGCEASANFSLTQPTAITFTNASSTNASCGNDNGAILVNATGGTGAIQYALNNGTPQASGSFGSLSSGSYLVEAIDANQCVAQTNLMVNDQGAPSIILLSVTNISCSGGNDGTVMVLGSGGTGALQYSVNGIDYQSSGAFSGLRAGVYNVSVRDAAGCTRGFALEITEPAPLQIGRVIERRSVSCNGGNDGSVEVLSSIGGIGTHTYSINSLNFQTSRVFNGLTAGTYTVIIRDAAGCTNSTSVVVNQPTALTATEAHTNLTCHGSNDGIINITANGGTQPYEYQWVANATTSDWQYGASFSDLAFGNYTIRVRDFNGCMTTVTANVTRPNLIAASINTGAATCGASDGTMSAVASGGTGAGYQYSINFGQTYNNVR